METALISTKNIDPFNVSPNYENSVSKAQNSFLWL